ncbi:unnamed protein product [Euphydryas editha]|uniref:NTF2 domain-containing protein n=1 Tax=Euphydryas editha TaxID=104508 RepID=A0AAU9U822_EUPED|nr:unnamed protein product [Euphydryas editha]
MSQFENYRKFLMSRVSATQNIVEYIENCVITENEIAKHSFHKIMVHNWTENEEKLFEVLSDYFGTTFIPVDFSTQNVITTFYTSSLTLILKIIKLDFMFPYCRNMYNLDILFNDQISTNIFEEKITIDDIVNRVVSSRFNENFELNLSNFCNDPVFLQKKIYFYNISLLSHFKILMIRMGRDTRILNLSNNNLSQVPLNILNFFIKGDLIGVNLSDNNIPSVNELQRISSKIEKLWVEGNPLCENLYPMSYIKQIVQKFPRLIELDGIKLNEHGIMLPFNKYFLVVPDKKTKIVVGNFVSLYFSHYDSKSRKKIDMFYDVCAQMTISTSFPDGEESVACGMHSRNILNPVKRELILNHKRHYRSRAAIVSVLSQLPKSEHDLSTFNIDVMKHDDNCLVLIIDGVFKEITDNRFIQFRRTFIFSTHHKRTMTYYYIVHEMFSMSLAAPDLVKNCFKYPIRNLNQLKLIDPEQEDKDIICMVFMYYSRLTKSEAEA